jgi:hypothetical protein
MMALFQATLVNKRSIYNTSLLPIKEMEIRFFAPSIEEAEMQMLTLTTRMFPDLALDNVYELGFTGSDPSVA